MTTQFEAIKRVFDLYFSDFCTTAKPFQLFADFLTDVHETTQHKSHCYILKSGASRMAVNSNSAFYAANVEELLSRIATRTFGDAHLYSCNSAMTP